MRETVDILRSGGVVVYPTETLYGLGCDAFNRAAAERVSRIKGRPAAKPLPLILGGTDMLPLVAERHEQDVLLLAEFFWPGPLSVLVPGRGDLAPGVRDPAGLVSVRVTPHPLAAQLSIALGKPLIATSANLSGRPAAARPQDLDPALIAQVDRVLTQEPLPAGGEPSTLVRIIGPGRIAVLRAGAVPPDRFAKAGFAIEP